MIKEFVNDWYFFIRFALSFLFLIFLMLILKKTKCKYHAICKEATEDCEIMSGIDSYGRISCGKFFTYYLIEKKINKRKRMRKRANQ